jgi:response regulator of citrate/malate metabolism
LVDDEDDFLLMKHALAALVGTITLIWKQEVDHLLESMSSSKSYLIFIDYYMPKKGGLTILG